MSCGSSHMHAKQNTKQMFVYTMSISSQTALSTSTRRLAAHIVPALTIYPREIQTLWSHHHDTGSYETLYEVDISSGDVVIYWNMTGTHVVVPDRQQYDEHTPTTSCKTPTPYDVRIKQIWYLVKVFRIKPLFQQVFFDFQHTQRPRWLFILDTSSMIT